MNENRPKIIAGVILKKDKKFLLVKEVLEDGKEYWIVPGGKVEFGESLVNAAKREIKEETNLRPKKLKLLNFKEAIHTKNNYHTIIFFFLGEEIVGKLKPSDPAILDAQFFSKDEIKKLRLVHSAQWAFENLKI